MAADAQDMTDFDEHEIERIDDLIEALKTLRGRYGDLPVIGSYDSGVMHGTVSIAVNEIWGDLMVDLYVDDH